MPVPTTQVASIDLIPGDNANTVGPAGAVRLTRTGDGLQVSVDGAAPVEIGEGAGGAGTLKAVALASSNITLEDEQTIDGVAVVAGDTVLVNGQTDASENGLYTVVDSAAWTRAEDFATAGQMIAGTLVSVQQGTVYGVSLWSFATTGEIEVGTTDLSFGQIGSPIGEDAWYQQQVAAMGVLVPAITRFEYLKVGQQPGGSALGTGGVAASVAGGGLGVANDTTWLHFATNIDPAPRTTPIAVAFRCKFTAIASGKTSILGLAATNTSICSFGWDHGTSATKFALFPSNGTPVLTVGNADTNWHNIVITIDGTTITVQVDGVSVATSAEVATLTDSACGPGSFTSSSETPGVIVQRIAYGYVDPT